MPPEIFQESFSLALDERGRQLSLKNFFPKLHHFLLEDLDRATHLRADPCPFIEAIHLPVILDGIGRSH